MTRGLLGLESSDEVVKFGALADGHGIMESKARLEDLEEKPYGPRAALGSESGSMDSESAFEGRL